MELRGGAGSSVAEEPRPAGLQWAPGLCPQPLPLSFWAQKACSPTSQADQEVLCTEDMGLHEGEHLCQGETLGDSLSLHLAGGQAPVCPGKQQRMVPVPVPTWETKETSGSWIQPSQLQLP